MTVTQTDTIPDRCAGVMDGLDRGTARLAAAIRACDRAMGGDDARDMATRILTDALAGTDLRWTLPPAGNARQVNPQGTLFGIWAAADTVDATCWRRAI